MSTDNADPVSHGEPDAPRSPTDSGEGEPISAGSAGTFSLVQAQDDSYEMESDVESSASEYSQESAALDRVSKFPPAVELDMEKSWDIGEVLEDVLDSSGKRRTPPSSPEGKKAFANTIDRRDLHFVTRNVAKETRKNLKKQAASSSAAPLPLPLIAHTYLFALALCLNPLPPMTKANSSLIVAASMHHPRSLSRKRNDENSKIGPGFATSSRMRQGSKVLGHEGGFQISGAHQAGDDRGKGLHSINGTRNTQKSKRRPLVPLDDLNGVPTNPDSGLNPPSSASQSPKREIKTLPTLQSLMAIDPEIERSKMGAGEKAARVRICASDLESRIVALEGMVREFNSKVADVVKDFKVLSSEINHFTLDYAAMDNDLFSAYESLEEEKFTTQEYMQRAQLAENELERVYSVLPTGITVPSAVDDMQGQVVA
ncbi:hypothetical protein NMY22_g14168 [Coprinellus aureogranulatus]|nr:hypothetical protein NMY22_g14168 [Coprinellus aureogranulatus]